MKRSNSQKDLTWLFGRHAVSAAVAAGRRDIYEIWCTNRTKTEAEALSHQAPAASVIEQAPPMFDKKFPGQVHQHLAAKVGPLPELDLDDVTDSQLLVCLDQVTDPHNLGAILRSADAFGAGAVIVPAHGSAPLTPVAIKAAAGGAETVPVITVSNLNKALDELKQHDFWSVGLTGHTEQELCALDLAGRKLVLVMGSEGKGLRPLVEKNCDFLAKLPMVGTVESLNVSVATGVALYAILQKQTEQE